MHKLKNRHESNVKLDIRYSTLSEIPSCGDVPADNFETVIEEPEALPSIFSIFEIAAKEMCGIMQDSGAKSPQFAPFSSKMHLSGKRQIRAVCETDFGGHSVAGRHIVGQPREQDSSSMTKKNS